MNQEQTNTTGRDTTHTPWLQIRVAPEGRRSPAPVALDLNNIFTSLQRHNVSRRQLLWALAQSLGDLIRFGGHTRKSISVAVHSVSMALYALRGGGKTAVSVALAALLHDSAEGLGLGDIVGPVRAAVHCEDLRRWELGVTDEVVKYIMGFDRSVDDLDMDRAMALDRCVLWNEFHEVIGTAARPWYAFRGVFGLPLPGYRDLLNLGASDVKAMFWALGAALLSARDNDDYDLSTIGMALREKLADYRDTRGRRLSRTQQNRILQAVATCVDRAVVEDYSDADGPADIRPAAFHVLMGPDFETWTTSVLQCANRGGWPSVDDSTRLVVDYLTALGLAPAVSTRDNGQVVMTLGGYATPALAREADGVWIDAMNTHRLRFDALKAAVDTIRTRLWGPVGREEMAKGATAALDFCNLLSLAAAMAGLSGIENGLIGRCGLNATRRRGLRRNFRAGLTRIWTEKELFSTAPYPVEIRSSSYIDGSVTVWRARPVVRNYHEYLEFEPDHQPSDSDIARFLGIEIPHEIRDIWALVATANYIPR